MKRTLLTLLMVLAIALTSVTPAFAKTRNLNVHNNTEDDVKITLTGTKNYSFTVEPGKIAKEVDEGTYKYSYTACGEKISGEVKVTDDMQWIIIDICGAPAEYAKFVVDSHLGDPITLELVGPETYSLSIELGSNKFLQLQTGVYVYSYTACGGTISGEVRVTKNGQGGLILYACEQMANRFDNSVATPSNLRIASHYAFPIRVTLLGPANYSVELVLGLNRLNVEPGTYSYFYTAYGQNRSGTFSVNEIGTTIIFSPNK
jgi:hypothetical protein